MVGSKVEYCPATLKRGKGSFEAEESTQNAICCFDEALRWFDIWPLDDWLHCWFEWLKEGCSVYLCQKGNYNTANGWRHWVFGGSTTAVAALYSPCCNRPPPLWHEGWKMIRGTGDNGGRDLLPEQRHCQVQQHSQKKERHTSSFLTLKRLL